MPKRTPPKADSSAFERSKLQKKSKAQPETVELVATRRVDQLWNRVPEYAKPFVALVSLLVGILLLFTLAHWNWVGGWLLLLVLGPLFVVGIPIAFVIMVIGYRQRKTNTKDPSKKLSE